MDFTVDRSVSKIFAMAIGFSLCWLGYQLFIAGVGGKASLSLQRDKLSVRFLNASPGLFFLMFGALVILYSLGQREVSAVITESPSGSREVRYIEKSAIAPGTNGIADSLYASARRHLQKGNLLGATEDFSLAFDYSPDYSDLYNDYAYALALLGKDLEKALILSRMSILRRPGVAAFHETAAELLLKMGDSTIAGGHLEVAARLDPRNSRYRGRLDGLKRSH